MSTFLRLLVKLVLCLRGKILLVLSFPVDSLNLIKPVGKISHSMYFRVALCISLLKYKICKDNLPQRRWRVDLGSRMPLIGVPWSSHLSLNEVESWESGLYENGAHPLVLTHLQAVYSLDRANTLLCLRMCRQSALFFSVCFTKLKPWFLGAGESRGPPVLFHKTAESCLFSAPHTTFP